MTLDQAFEYAANRSAPIYKNDFKCSPRSITFTQVCECPRQIEVQITFNDEDSSTLTVAYNETEVFTAERRAMIDRGFWYVLGKSHGAVLIMCEVANTLLAATKEKK